MLQDACIYKFKFPAGFCISIDACSIYSYKILLEFPAGKYPSFSAIFDHGRISCKSIQMQIFLHTIICKI